MVLNWLKSNAVAARKKMAVEVTKYRNRDFLQATIDGCGLMAAADGKITPDEKKKMASFIERSDALRHFEMGQVIEAFNKVTSELEFDHEIGKAEALKRIGKIRSNPDQARLLVRVVCAVANADGSFDDAERKLAADIARELGLNPADFDL